MKRNPDQHVVEVDGAVFTIKQPDGRNFAFKRKQGDSYYTLKEGDLMKWRGEACIIVAIKPDEVKLRMLGEKENAKV